MERVTEIEQILILQKVFNKVFKINDPFGEMFQDYVKERLILCPTNGYCLDEDQYKALVETVASMGEAKICISEVESEDCFTSMRPNHWVVSTTTQYDGYIRLPLVLENSIYSLDGKWGILISHEEHAVIGGTQEFITKFKETYKSWNKGISNFQEKWDYNKKHYDSNLEWLPKFLSHINGNT